MPSKTIHNIEPYRETMTALDNAALASGDQILSVISGVAGTGKSFCAREFVARHPEHLLVHCPPRCLLTSPRALLDVIALPLGIPVTTQSRPRELAAAIISALGDRRGLLLVDEAEELTTPIANLVRYLAEESGRPACYIGAPRIKEVLLRHEPLSTRIGYRYDVRACTVADLQTMFPRTYSPAAYEEIVRVTRGNLRLIFQLWPKLADAKRDVGFEGVDPAVVRAISEEFLLIRAA